jgi:hypothetical protein
LALLPRGSPLGLRYTEVNAPVAAPDTLARSSTPTRLRGSVVFVRNGVVNAL